MQSTNFKSCESVNIYQLKQTKIKILANHETKEVTKTANS